MVRGLPGLLGVVGAGQMGAGIAQVAASSGLQVRRCPPPAPASAAHVLASAARRHRISCAVWHPHLVLPPPAPRCTRAGAAGGPSCGAAGACGGGHAALAGQAGQEGRPERGPRGNPAPPAARHRPGGATMSGGMPEGVGATRRRRPVVPTAPSTPAAAAPLAGAVGGRLRCGGGARGRGAQGGDLPAAGRAGAAARGARLQHLLHLHHAPGRRHPAPRQSGGPALHEPGGWVGGWVGGVGWLEGVHRTPLAWGGGGDGCLRMGAPGWGRGAAAKW